MCHLVKDKFSFLRLPGFVICPQAFGCCGPAFPGEHGGVSCPQLGQRAPLGGERVVESTATGLPGCAWLSKWNERGIWDNSHSRHMQKQKLPDFPVFAIKIPSCLGYIGLIGAHLFQVPKIKICLWTWVLQAGRGAEADESQKTSVSVHESVKA